MQPVCHSDRCFIQLFATDKNNSWLTREKCTHQLHYTSS